MLKGNYMFTSESVTEGHPDKVCDQISDAVLDEILKEDPLGRVACETMVTNGLVVIGGEITTETYVDVEGVARKVISDIGYNSSVYGFDAKSCAVISSIHKQSKNIARGVNTGGAGDQGIATRPLAELRAREFGENFLADQVQYMGALDVEEMAQFGAGDPGALGSVESLGVDC